LAVSKIVKNLRDLGKPLVFVNPVSTGRVRDLPLKALVDFILAMSGKFSFIVSSFKRPDIVETIALMNLSGVASTEGMVTGVKDLCLIIGSCDYTITTDSGITHLAEALFVPCGSVFNVVTADERLKHYRYSESLSVDFSLEGVCRTPCYVHALKDGDVCPGMAFMNEKEGKRLFYDYPPCVTHLEGGHLAFLLEALAETFGMKQERDSHG
jgi:hypothetical protein